MKHETRLKIFRDEHHFASAHFLVEMGKCERLHGHNYSVTVELKGTPGADHTLVDFNIINPVIDEICERFDHRVIIAGEDPRQTIKIENGEVEIRFGNKRYVFPEGDCVFIPVPAITVEIMAAHICELLIGEIAGRMPNMKWIEVGVREGAGQMALYRRDVE